MDPQEFLATDPKRLNDDLTSLIKSAAAAVSDSATSASTTLTSPAPATDPRLRKRMTPQQASSKKLKLESHRSHPNVHPSRLGLLQQPDAEQRATSSMRRSLDRRTSHRDEFAVQAPYETTGANTIPLGDNIHPDGPADGKTWSTLRNAVRRQWDPRKSDLAYEELLRKRRDEHLVNVDRYVPGGQPVSSPTPVRQASHQLKPFLFENLPDKPSDIILALLLIKEQPILIDSTWLRPFVQGKSRVPSANKTIGTGIASYTLPVDWSQLLSDVSQMQTDLKPFTAAMEEKGNRTRRERSPCHDLTTSLLRVSKGVHKQAASVFYGENTFQFPCPTSAWMQLESFLATIGPLNVAHLRSISIHVPLWHRGMHEDYVEGAILDLTSPASRFGVVQPAARDRLLSAIRNSVQELLNAGQLMNFSLQLEHRLTTERWSGRYCNDRQLISVADAEARVTRKQQGIAILRTASEALPAKPTISIHHPTASSKIANTRFLSFEAAWRLLLEKLKRMDGRLTNI